MSSIGLERQLDWARNFHLAISFDYVNSCIIGPCICMRVHYGQRDSNIQATVFLWIANDIEQTCQFFFLGSRRPRDFESRQKRIILVEQSLLDNSNVYIYIFPRLIAVFENVCQKLVSKQPTPTSLCA